MHVYYWKRMYKFIRRHTCVEMSAERRTSDLNISGFHMPSETRHTR